ncbi:hypothetical protein [Thalassotalea insulae]|nr:hypothetical protein [Thalassotalea insulae]
MKLAAVVASCSVFLFASCATRGNICEDITEAKEQMQACQLLKKQIANAKERPLIRTELERRYENDCIEIRYYRDDIQEAKCGNKENLEQIKKAVIEEQNQ